MLMMSSLMNPSSQYSKKCFNCSWKSLNGADDLGLHLGGGDLLVEVGLLDDQVEVVHELLDVAVQVRGM
jgi:hypothetical protein